MNVRLTLLLLFCIFSSTSLFANMSSPVKEGTQSTTVISSREVDILHENLEIKILGDKMTALFNVEYKIKCEKGGKIIPLLFYALNYKSGFKILVDGQPVIYHSYGQDTILNFATSQPVFHPNGNYNRYVTDVIWGPEYGISSHRNAYKQSIDLKDFIYFETMLDTGEHIINVSYIANVWEIKSDWTKTYSFRYSLYPARSWRSFGGIKISMDASNVEEKIHTNLPPPHTGSFKTKATWQFDSIPADYLNFDYNPNVSKTASALIWITPQGLTLISWIILISVHLFSMYLYRRKYWNVRFSWVMITGSVVLPFFFLIALQLSFDIIISAIGEHANNHKGYMVFMLVMFYPIIMPIYWLVMSYMDIRMKKRRKKKILDLTNW